MNPDLKQKKLVFIGGEQRSRISQQKFQAMVDESILRTVAYGDVFDYPMTIMEIYRYLIGMSVLPYTISNSIFKHKALRNHLSVVGKYACLRGREYLVGLRQRRAVRSEALWPTARSYGLLIASLPFVRMVAVTGSLAVDNPGENDDIDYLVVASPGRVWLCRSMAIAVVKLAARRGKHLCPNYVLSEKSLWHVQEDLYYAHELAQMVPLYGMDVYAKMRFANLWTYKYLPNTYSPPPHTRMNARPLMPTWTKLFGEKCLSGSSGERLEKWEMERKIGRFSQQSGDNDEAEFTSDWCKGHFEGHAFQTKLAYQHRLDQLGLGPLDDRLSELLHLTAAS